MSYQVLARKWRPRNFQQLVGQEHVARALINGLDNERLHHAFLFTGTRGVGKTTIARILAKSLNCDNGVSSQPCGQCSACTEIDEGRFVDLIEVDAASRTKVEDTRDLLDNVQYAPTRGRYKVYLIDEVHMLSNHSFNALLKTLEEPPPHVKFLLATTDPQKLPVTILSRCLQFNLRKLSVHEIIGHLQHLLGEEGIEYDEHALRLLARGAEGSMRDALSLLDQAIAYGGGRVGDADVRDMLGTIESGHVFELIERVHAQDSAGALQVIAQLDERSPDYADVLGDMLSVLHHVAMEQQAPGGIIEEWDDPQRIQALAAAVSPQDVQLYYQIALKGREDLQLNPDAREGFEMVLLRMIAFRPWQSSTGEAAGSGKRPASVQTAPAPAPQVAEQRPAAPAPTNDEMPPAPPPYAGAEARPEPVQPAAPAPKQPAPQGPATGDLPDWHAIHAALNIQALPGQLAANSQLEAIEDDVVRLILDQAHAQLLTEGSRQRLETALQEYFASDIKLKVQPGIAPGETPAQRQARRNEEKQQAAVESIEQDENVQMMKEMFGASVAYDAIQPIDD